MELFNFETAIITQCIFSIVYLSSNLWQRNKWLVLIFSAILLLYIGFLINESTLTFWQKLIIGNPSFLLLCLPATYFYTLTLVNESVLAKKRSFIHFLPFLVFYILFLIIEIEPMDEFLDNMSSGKDMRVQNSFLLVFLGMIFFYGKAIFKLIGENKIKYKEEYAETNIYLTLDWLNYLCWLVFIIMISCIVGLVLTSFLAINFFPIWLLKASFLMVCFMISYFSFRQPTLYQVYEKIDSKIKAEKEEKITQKTAKNLLSTTEIDQLSLALEHYMATDQPFLNPKIKLPDIAAQLKISPYVLSWFLNEHYQMNFFTFINQHRIKKAVALMQNAEFENYTLEAISQMSGFQSKTTFNSRFKEIQGVTPSVFRKRLIDTQQKGNN